LQGSSIIALAIPSIYPSYSALALQAESHSSSDDPSSLSEPPVEDPALAHASGPKGLGTPAS